MSPMQLFRICVRNVMLNKFRSFLTMLGIIIGVSSVVVLVGLTQGSKKDVQNSLDTLGANVIQVQVYGSSEEELTFDEYKDLDLTFAKDNVPVIKSRSSVRRNAESSNYQVIGTKTNYLKTLQIKVQNGRNLSDLDIESGSNVAIIGSDVATSMFPTENPISQKMIINSTLYTVIGVLESGNSTTSNTDSSIIIPISSMVKATGSEDVTNLYFVSNSEDQQVLKMMQNRIERVVGQKISTDNFEVVTQDTTAETVSDVSSTMEIMIAVVGVVALVVSGIGVMNIMLVSVSERTREIGVRKAIGATNLSILGQFLIEAVLLTTLGGLLGVGCSYLIQIILNALNITFIMEVNAIYISIVFSAIIGIVFGIIPAMRASTLKPVDALKYE